MFFRSRFNTFEKIVCGLSFLLVTIIGFYPVNALCAVTETVRIDTPFVNAPSHEYKNVKFERGDIVEIDAGGCVQTGGHGRTWKRYVDPQGADSDRLYHGLVLIPGAMAAPKRIKDIIGTKLTVTSDPPSDHPFLQLGYEDDNYDDNGYWGHDNGTDDQCKDIGNAYVLVTITRPSTKPIADTATTPANNKPSLLAKTQPVATHKSDKSGPEEVAPRQNASPVAAKVAPAEGKAEDKKTDKNDQSFWTTLPGILTAVASLITAIGGLIAIIRGKKR